MNGMRITLKGAVSLGLVLVALALAQHAGWTKGSVFILSFLAMIALSSAYLWRTNPEVVVARSAIHRGTKPWDRAIFILLELSITAICVVASFDRGRFPGARVPSWLVVVGYVPLCTGWITFVWAMRVNKFAEVTVRIQTDRGHRVVDTGPYAIVRHPFYVGAILWLAGVPLALGSFWAMIPTAVAIFLIVVRTVLEDPMLRNELAGYQAYAARVRYRLIPGVW